MSFANEASKLLTNKYFLYFIVFLAVSNVLGYLVTNKINAVIFFALICLLMANFSKNMIVVLIVAIIATNLLMVNGKMREGLENAEGTTELTDEQKLLRNKIPIVNIIENVNKNNNNNNINSGIVNIIDNKKSDNKIFGFSKDLTEEQILFRKKKEDRINSLYTK